MIPDKWNNGISAIITLFTRSQNEFLIQHVCYSFDFSDSIIVCYILARTRAYNCIKYFNNTSRRSKSVLFFHWKFAFSSHVLWYQNLSDLPFDLNSKKNFLLVIHSHSNILFHTFHLVFDYLQFIISNYNQIEMINKIFSCLSKWIEFGISILKIEPFFDYLFNSLNNQKLFNEVSDCLIVIFTSPDALKYPSTFSRLLPYVVQFETLLDQSLTTRYKIDMIFLIFLYSNTFESIAVRISLSILFLYIITMFIDINTRGRDKQ
jgi:hypothetical protein